jgi:hypothetical protein
LVEFALIFPVLLALILGSVDFGRVMQARVTSESSAKSGAFWGASHLQNATAALPPAYALASSPKNCGSASGLDYGPNCNILARACAEAAGLPGYSGGAAFTGDGGDSYQVCSSGSTGGVCTPSGGQSNPFLTVAWSHLGVAFTPGPGSGPKPAIGDALTVTGVYCFKTFFPGPMSRLTWSSAVTFSVQP